MPMPPPSEAAKLAVLPVNSTGTDFQIMPIDLPTALRLANESNPTIALARERIQQAYAVQQQANAIWLPNLQLIPANYGRHDGAIQSQITGRIIDVSFSSIANSGAAVFDFATSDALFAPLVTRQKTQAQTQAAQAVANNVQLSVALTYLDLLQVYAQLAINAETLANATEMMRNAEAAAIAGKSSTSADVQRARTEVQVRRQERRDLEARSAIVSAQLAQLLLLEPTVELHPLEPAVVPITLVADDIPLDELVIAGYLNRPELAENRALVQAALFSWRQARSRPLIPQIEVSYLSGGLAGGPNSYVGNYGGQGNAQALALWELRNLGIGDLARIREQRSLYNQSNYQLVQVQAQVAAEVTAAAKIARAHRRNLDNGQDGVRQALEMWRRLSESAFGLTGGDRKYDPLQPLLAEQALSQARLQYLGNVIEYNKAQFRLYTAMGQPPQESLPSAAAIAVAVPPAPALPLKPPLGTGKE